MSELDTVEYVKKAQVGDIIKVCYLKEYSDISNGVIAVYEIIPCPARTPLKLSSSTMLPDAPEQALDEYPMPDPMLTLDDLEKCGYRDGDMLPLSKERAMELYERDLTVYAVVDGGSAEMLFDREELALLSVDRKRK